jgi:hypothetical protein
VNRAAFDVIEQGGKAFDEACCLDAAHRRPLAHAETPLTEIKQRGARGSKIEPSCLDLDQMQQQTTEETVCLEANRRQAGEELFVREIRKCHVAFLHPRFSCSSSPFKRATGDPIAWRSDPSAERRLGSEAERRVPATRSRVRTCSMASRNASTKKRAAPPSVSRFVSGLPRRGPTHVETIAACVGSSCASKGAHPAHPRE